MRTTRAPGGPVGPVTNGRSRCETTSRDERPTAVASCRPLLNVTRHITAILAQFPAAAPTPASGRLRVATKNKPTGPLLSKTVNDAAQIQRSHAPGRRDPKPPYRRRV